MSLGEATAGTHTSELHAGASLSKSMHCRSGMVKLSVRQRPLLSVTKTTKCIAGPLPQHQAALVQAAATQELQVWKFQRKNCERIQ